MRTYCPRCGAAALTSGFACNQCGFTPTMTPGTITVPAPSRECSICAVQRARIAELESAAEVAQERIAELDAEIARISEAESEIKKRCDSRYVEMIQNAKKPECLGWEAKAREGKFTQAEFDAHAVGHKLYGEHVAYANALKLLRPTSPSMGILR